jgi:hypothetical protein
MDRAEKFQLGIEESLQLKRKLLLSILAMVPAALLPLTVSAQAAPSADTSAVDRPEVNYKYAVYAGYAYTSLNQVNQSRYGLQGINVSVTRDWAKYFGTVAEGAYYRYATNSGSATSPGNPGDPSVDTVLFGPVVHAQLFGKYSLFVDVLVGGEHTGGENVTPKVSFAGGFGGGLEYKLRPRFSLRAGGERIASSFSLTNNTPGLAYSPHTLWNARGNIGLVYRF